MIVHASYCCTINVAELYHVLKLVFADYLDLFCFYRLLRVFWKNKLDLLFELRCSSCIELYLADQEKSCYA
jgi:hypothetical protein